jgi:hypothetical protein
LAWAFVRGLKFRRIDPADVARISNIKVADMRTQPGYVCNDCIAKSACIGGCHCRYVGGSDAMGPNPAERFNVPASYCESMRGAMTGLLQGAAIERYIVPKGAKQAQTHEGFDRGRGEVPKPAHVHHHHHREPGAPALLPAHAAFERRPF